VLWRYVPLRTLFFYLNGLVFIPSVAKLRAEDPFEGEFYEAIAWFNAAFSDVYGSAAPVIDEWILEELCLNHERKLVEINKNDPNGANAAPEIFRKHYFDFVRRTRFAWCWFLSNLESAAMWSIYGNQGVAIKSTVGKISAIFEKTGRNFTYGRMTYVDYRSGVSTDFNPERKSDYRLLLRPFLLKRKEYESEHEVRFVTSGADRTERGGVLLKDMNPQDWISAIRLWPGLTANEESSLHEAVHQFIPEVDCRKSDLFSGPSGPSELTEMIIADLEQSADSSWTEGTDKIPPPLKIV